MIYIQLCLSAVSIVSTIMQGDGNKWGWALGVITTSFWIYYTIVSHQWGLVPLNLFLVGVQVRNYYKIHKKGK